MVEVRLVPVARAHIDAVAAALRPADRAEVWAAAHLMPFAAVSDSVARSETAFTGLVDGQPALIAGVGRASLLGATGVPWMLGTALIDRHPVAFLSHSRRVVAGWRRDFARLVNRVDARNRAAVRWLAWLGFRIDPAKPFGPEGLPFHPFIWSAD